jgi:glycosyltransferase involved in cell wall biosynthesis
MTTGFAQDVFEGHLDRVENGRVFGWLWQSDRPNDPVSVDLYIDDVCAQTILASLYRADLEIAGKGNGRHAFELSLPEQCLDGKPHSIRLCYHGTTTDLYGSPQTVSLEPEAASAYRFNRAGERGYARSLVERLFQVNSGRGDSSVLNTSFSDSLSFVLPVALSDTGRPGNDLDRIKLVLESFVRCFNINDIGTFLIITRPQDMKIVSGCLGSTGFAEFIDLVDETMVCPELSGDPDTFHDFPTHNKGWFRQQLLKLGAAKRVSSKFYMTLDSDVVFTRPFRASDLIRCGRSVINTQTAADFRLLFTDEMAEESIRIRVDRDRRAEHLLGVRRIENCFYGETPVVLSTSVVLDLLAYIESHHQESWCGWLVKNTPWTEYSLYFTFAEGLNLFDRFHIRGGFNSVLRMSDSLWYPAHDYRSPRSIENWTWTDVGVQDGVTVVVQSYLGYDTGIVRAKVLELAGRARMPPVVSVIVPAYNAGPYIERCIGSLLLQTVPLEIIVVNDGSTDDTLQRVRAIDPPSLHSIVLIEQDNRGLPAARNAGLSRACAPFIGFVDADDWVEPDTYSTMVAAATELGAELVIFNGQMVDHNTQATKPFQDDDRLRELAERHTTPLDPLDEPDVFRLDTCACKRLYSRLMLERAGFRFVEGVLFEDILAHFQLLMASRKILLVNRKFYNYRINHPGRITDRRDSQILTVFEVIRLSEDTLRTNRASDQVWGNFIWFQNWVLRWLGSQVDPAHQREFLRGVVSVGRRFPRKGIIAFQHQFGADQIAQWTVALQMLGWKRTFLSLARNTLSERDRRLLAIATRLKTFAVLFGRLA